MGWHWQERKITFLLAITLGGLVYSGWVQFLGTLTGTNQVDGIIGVVFGLYICSHPAAFMVDLLFLKAQCFWWFFIRSVSFPVVDFQPSGASRWMACHFYWNNKIDREGRGNNFIWVGPCIILISRSSSEGTYVDIRGHFRDIGQSKPKTFMGHGSQGA